MVQVPLVDLRSQYQMIKHEVMTSLEDVLEHMHLFLGPHSQEFEKEFAAYCGCEYAVGLSEQKGVTTGIHYPVPLHLQPACARYGYSQGMLPVAEAAAKRITSLPMYPELTEEQIQVVVDAVKKATLAKV
jgi:dTDP-4-amino-4,6-dideoxygalactose transaminase